MPTLTAAQIEYVRKQTGDTCDGDYDADDAYMQYLYDNQVAAMPLCANGDPLGGLVFLVLKRRIARASVLFDETDSGSGVTRKTSQKTEHLREMLEEQKSECGFGGGVTVSTFDLGLDRDCGGSEYASRLSGYSLWGGWS